MKLTAKTAFKFVIGLIGFLFLIVLTVAMAMFEFLLFILAHTIKPFSNNKFTAKDIFVLTPELFRAGNFIADWAGID